MRLVPALTWQLEGDVREPLDPRLFPLLRAVDASASLTAAVFDCGISYRAAWGLLRDYERKLGTPLVRLERGRGASLSPMGEVLIAADRAAARRLARVLPGLAAGLATLPRPASAAPAPQLRMAASHDLALAALANALRDGSALTLELSFMGSLPALKEFAEGRADVAGFHVPIGRRRDWDRSAYLHGLQARRDRLLRFVDREQGLILPHGNPAAVRSLRDVAAKGLRFINRQRGSGTRLLMDQMLAQDRIDHLAIVGYGNEEFTHLAVAATVASGGADAGFGLRAAAAEYRLAFVPLLRERYFLAVRAKAVALPALQQLIAALKAPAFARIARRYAADRAETAGTIVGLDAIEAVDRG